MSEIDGSVMEGGGQIVRVSAALSCITGTEVTITGIRAGRSSPGLRTQHLAGLELVRDIGGGRLDGASVGSTRVTLSPPRTQGGTQGGTHGKTGSGGGGGRHVADTQTAGSVALVLQVALPCAALFAAATSRLCLMGGTNAGMAPHIDYVVEVFKPVAERFGVRFDCDVRRRGYHPRGGGKVLVTVHPVKELRAVVMTDPGTVTRIRGRSFVAGVLPYQLAEDMSAAAVRTIRTEVEEDVPVDIRCLQEDKDEACGSGNGIIVVAESSTGCLFAGSALGEKGVGAEQVGAEAARMLLRNVGHKGCVDEFLQDQLIVFMALAKGRSRIRTGAVTLHTETAIHVAEQLTAARFTISQCEEEAHAVTYIIECQGAGVTNPNL